MIILLDRLCLADRISSTFFVSYFSFLFYLYCFSISTYRILCILSSKWSGLLPMFSNAFFILLIEIFSSRISVWFFFKTYISVDIFLLFIIFSLTSFSYLSLFFFSSLNIFKIVVLKSLPSNSNACASSGMVSEDLFCFLERAICYFFLCLVIFC